MPSTAAAKPVRHIRSKEDSGAGYAWQVVLFNCDCHSFDQVERQLIKAVRCTLSQARRYSMEVHTRGSAVVYRGARERCEAAAMVLEEIGLKTEVSE